MNVSRLTVLHINIIGLVTAVVLAVVLFFVLIKPKNDDIDKTTKEVDSTVQQGGTIAKVDENKKTLVKEQKNTQEIKAQWAVDEKYYMPDLHFSNNLLDLYEFRGYKNMGFRDLPTYWGKWITGWYDSQAKYGVVRTPETVFPIDAFSTDPNQLTSLSSITFPKAGAPWKVQLECKTFNDAMNHLRRFNKMQGMGVPVINNVTLAGQSPHLMMNYELAMYIIPSAPPPAQDPRIGAGAGGGGGGGGPMGGMPMMGGMPAGKQLPSMGGPGGK